MAPRALALRTSGTNVLERGELQSLGDLQTLGLRAFDPREIEENVIDQVSEQLGAINATVPTFESLISPTLLEARITVPKVERLLRVTRDASLRLPTDSKREQRDELKLRERVLLLLQSRATTASAENSSSAAAPPPKTRRKRPREEGNRERLIRTGVITPFASVEGLDRPVCAKRSDALGAMLSSRRPKKPVRRSACGGGSASAATPASSSAASSAAPLLITSGRSSAEAVDLTGEGQSDVRGRGGAKLQKKTCSRLHKRASSTPTVSALRGRPKKHSSSTAATGAHKRVARRRSVRGGGGGDRAKDDGSYSGSDVGVNVDKEDDEGWVSSDGSNDAKAQTPPPRALSALRCVDDHDDVAYARRVRRWLRRERRYKLVRELQLELGNTEQEADERAATDEDGDDSESEDEDGEGSSADDGGAAAGGGQRDRDRDRPRFEGAAAGVVAEAVASEHAVDYVRLAGGFSIPRRLHAKLFAYQRTGVKWLWELHEQGAGGVMADEMGLGKTVQLAAFLAGLQCSRRLKPALVVCPATVLGQWASELRRWHPPLRVLLLHKSGEAASTLGWAPARLLKSVMVRGDVLLTTFEGLRIHRELLLPRRWGCAVLDEGHRIRNPDAEITLVCKQLQTVHRVVLTGAPIQNNLRELWSLFDFVFPGRLGTLPMFENQFSMPINAGGYVNATPMQVHMAFKCATVLKETVTPYLLRRLKRDVQADLPAKTEQVLFCNLLPEQVAAYRKYLGGDDVAAVLRDSLEGEGVRGRTYRGGGHGVYAGGRRRIGLGASAGTRKLVFRAIRTLQKICNHADLVHVERKTEIPGYGAAGRSGKLMVLKSILRMWHSQGHRVLLFSQGRQMLDVLEDFVRDEGYAYCRMDGTTPIQARQPLIARFNGAADALPATAAEAEQARRRARRERRRARRRARARIRRAGRRAGAIAGAADGSSSSSSSSEEEGEEEEGEEEGDGVPAAVVKGSGPFVFLLTTRVGGLGVNLTGANRVVIYDPDWNPSTDIQARERAWRLGQKRAVTVYRLITSGTIEEKMYHRQIFKQFLTNKVLSDPRQRRFFKLHALRDLFTLQLDAGDGTETSDLFTDGQIERSAATNAGNAAAGNRCAAAATAVLPAAAAAAAAAAEDAQDDMPLETLRTLRGIAVRPGGGVNVSEAGGGDSVDNNRILQALFDSAPAATNPSGASSSSSSSSSSAAAAAPQEASRTLRGRHGRRRRTVLGVGGGVADASGPTIATTGFRQARPPPP